MYLARILFMVSIVLIGLSMCAIYRSPLTWKKSKTMERIENEEYDLILNKRNQIMDGAHASTNIYETDDMEYVQEVAIGTPEQRFTVWLKLVSNEMFVPLYSCTTKGCEGKKKFEPHKSETFTNSTDEEKWRMRIDGVEAVGYFGNDLVKIGSGSIQPLIIPNIRFGIAEKIYHYRTIKTEFDGFLGLAFSIHAAENTTSQTFVDRLVEKGILDRPVFTLWLGERLKAGVRAGQITYGAVDNTNCGTVEAEVFLHGFASYEYEINGIKMGNLEYKRNYYAYHTLSTWISGPQEPVQKMAKMAGAKLDRSGMYVIACNASFPDLIIYIGKKSLQIPSNKLILEMNYGNCIFAMLPLSKESSWWEIGAPFHRQYCTVFDVGAKKLLFSRLLPRATSTTTQSPVTKSTERTLYHFMIVPIIAYFILF